MEKTDISSENVEDKSNKEKDEGDISTKQENIHLDEDSDSDSSSSDESSTQIKDKSNLKTENLLNMLDDDSEDEVSPEIANKGIRSKHEIEVYYFF